MQRPVHSLLSRLDVSAVYWIDDENASEDELDINKLVSAVAESLGDATKDQQRAALDVIKKRPGVTTELRQVASSLGNALSSGDVTTIADNIEDILQTKLAAQLQDMELKQVLSSMLRELPQPLAPHEKEALSATFLPQTEGAWSWHPLSFSKWSADHGSILNKHCDETKRALLVVDLQNTRETSGTSGLDILNQWAVVLRNCQRKDAVIVVALTGMVKPEGELRESRRLTSKLFDGDVPGLPVFVLSKERLRADGEDATVERAMEAITHILSRMRACQIHSNLAQCFESLFADSVKQAFATLQQLSIEELLFSVSSSSFQEGAHEVDTLVRMASIAQRQALLNGLSADTEIQSNLIELRGLGVENVKRSQLDDVDGLEDLRSSELHDPGEIVNALLSPISAGDIFEFSDATSDGLNSYFVLIANACDLILRNSTGKRKLLNGLLLPLSFNSSDDADDSSVKFVTNFPKGSPLHGKKAWVDLRYYLTIPLDVLDLCWSNKEGACKWSKSSAVSLDLNLLPAQKLRYEEISNGFEKASAAALAKLTPTPYRSILRSDGQLVSVDFGIRRISRFANSLTFELVQKTARALSRPPVAHDYSGAKVH